MPDGPRRRRVGAAVRARHLRPAAVQAALGVVPIAVAAAWVPLRGRLPGTDVALLLVLTTAVVASVGGHLTVAVGALSSVASFDFFDTPPYGQLFITRAADVATAIVLLGAGALVGELAVTRRRYRSAAIRSGADFTVMASAARLVSVGEPPSLVVAALAGELTGLLGLRSCRFVYGGPDGTHPSIGRDGTLSPPGTAGPAASPEAGPAAARIDLPVWTGEEVRGHFQLELRTPAMPPRDRLLAAAGIGEQAAVALAGVLVDPPDRPERPRRLRLVR